MRGQMRSSVAAECAGMLPNAQLSLGSENPTDPHDMQLV